MSAGSVNKVILIGRLGKDPEIKYMPSGDAVAKFSLATDEVFKDRSGEQQRRTEWHNIVAWKRLAERSEEHTSELQSRFDLVCRLLLEKINHPSNEWWSSKKSE